MCIRLIQRLCFCSCHGAAQPLHPVGSLHHLFLRSRVRLGRPRFRRSCIGARRAVGAPLRRSPAVERPARCRWLGGLDVGGEGRWRTPAKPSGYAACKRSAEVCLETLYSRSLPILTSTENRATRLSPIILKPSNPILSVYLGIKSPGPEASTPR